jgi:hypothetical protein
MRLIVMHQTAIDHRSTPTTPWHHNIQTVRMHSGHTQHLVLIISLRICAIIRGGGGHVGCAGGVLLFLFLTLLGANEEEGMVVVLEAFSPLLSNATD